MMGYRRWSWFLDDVDAGEVGQEKFLPPDEANWGNENELKDLGLWVCSTAVILPGQKENNSLVYVGIFSKQIIMQQLMQLLLKLLKNPCTILYSILHK